MARLIINAAGTTLYKRRVIAVREGIPVLDISIYIVRDLWYENEFLQENFYL
jgi:hypothetical protein